MIELGRTVRQIQMMASETRAGSCRFKALVRALIFDDIPRFLTNSRRLAIKIGRSRHGN